MSRFAQTWCSQCGHPQGPGDAGYSRCEDHESESFKKYAALRRANDAHAERMKAAQAQVWRRNHTQGATA